MSTNNRSTVALAALILVGTVAGFLGGCAPVVLPPSQHAPTSPDRVNLYQSPPAKYEALGIIAMPVTPEMKWDERGDSGGADLFAGPTRSGSVR